MENIAFFTTGMNFGAILAIAGIAILLLHMCRVLRDIEDKVGSRAGDKANIKMKSAKPCKAPVERKSKRVESLGKYLQKLREKKGMMKKDVEGMANLGVSYMSKLEKGKIRRPADAVIKSLAAIYGVTPRTLFQRIKG